MLLSLSILQKIDNDYYFLEHIDNSSEFGYFRKKYVKESIIFINRVISQKIPIKKKIIINTKEYKNLNYHCQAFKISTENIQQIKLKYRSYFNHKASELVFIAITDIIYPQYLVFRLLQEIQENYINNIVLSQLNPKDVFISNFLQSYFMKSQTPEELSKIYTIQMKIKSTKESVQMSLEKMLERGEKLETLINQTQDLSKISKNFLYTSKKMNRCCVIL